MDTRTSRYSARRSLLFVLGTLFTAAPALAAVIAPALPEVPNFGPDPGRPYSSVRARISGYASSTSLQPGFAPQLDSFEASNTNTDANNPPLTAVLIDEASAQSGELIASSTAITSAGFGKLRAKTVVSHTSGGYADVRADATVDFIDVFTVDAGNGVTANLDTKWAIHGSLTPGTWMHSQLWIFPFGPLPQGDFLAESYYSEIRSYGAPVVIDSRGSGENGSIGLIDGASYWIYGRLQISAQSTADQIDETQFGGSSDANFYDTVTLSLTPSASTPGVTFQTISRYTYPAIPEPGSAFLAITSLLSLAALRRRK